MSSRRSRFGGSSGRYNFGRSNKDSYKKRRRIRPWLLFGKNKDHHDDDDGVMMSGDSPPPPLRGSIPPSPGFDIPDDGRPSKLASPTSGSKILRQTDTEVIEEAVPIVEKTLPVPQPKPKLEKNGSHYDQPDGKKLVDDYKEDDSCVIKCISFTQQCCECTIL